MTDFQPTAKLETLKARDALIRKIRLFFESRNFLHVETPLLSNDTVVDRYLHPLSIDRNEVLDRTSAAGQGTSNPFEQIDDKLWLQTSPEFAMKRLLTSGLTHIYQICKAFRKGESGGGVSGSKHNPEFTMLEWYRVGDGLDEAMELLSDFADTVLGCGESELMTYKDAFVRFANVDPFTATVEQFQSACHLNEVETSTFESMEPFQRDQWLNLIISEIVEPQLGKDRPTIVYDWPASQSALAIVRKKNGIEVAERFELYFNGIELANGYHELLCPDELLERNHNVNQQRISDGSGPLPNKSRLLDAMRSGLPACSGVALGVDRLMMAVMGLNRIDDVIAFPIDRA